MGDPQAYRWYRDGVGRSPRGRGAGAKPAWYLPVGVLIDVLAPLSTVLAVLSATGDPRPGRRAVAVACCWAAVLLVRGRYRSDRVGEAPAAAELARDALALVAVLAVLRLLTGRGDDPYPALLAIVAFVPLSWGSRWMTHRHLVQERRAGRAVRRALLVGDAASVAEVADRLTRRTDQPVMAVGCCLVGEGEVEGDGGPVRAGRLGVRPAASDAVVLLPAARSLSADLLCAIPGPGLTGDRLRRLSWLAHAAGLGFMVGCGLDAVAPHRLSMEPVAGLAMLKVAPPRHAGPGAWAKRATDLLAAGALLLFLAPLMLAIGVAVRIDSPGPALHRQLRVGACGRRFVMWKFRTMVSGADRQRDALEAFNESDGRMFKIRRDPRVTRIGRLLRRYSLDELPQLLNVLAGRMSLVGPRPPLPEEAAGYDETESRRLAVRPGMTGAWQVSGRSDLSWEETVALDLYYVDNWTYGRDVRLLGRTARAVLDGRGAY